LSRTRVHIKTVGHVLQELSKQYRRADRGEIDWPAAVAAAKVLREIRTTLEGDGFERRITAIERLVDERLPAGKAANGHGGSARLGLHS
jgi:hypothetical protein